MTEIDIVVSTAAPTPVNLSMSTGPEIDVFYNTVATGPPGPAGPAGPAGPTGPTGPAGSGQKVARLHVQDYCVCDGITDDTAGFRSMITAARAIVAAGGAASIWNPGLPIAISGPVLVSEQITLNAPTGTSGAAGAQFVALSAAAQVFIAGRAGMSSGWTMNASASKPVVSTYTVTTSSTSKVWTVTGATNAQLDALYGAMVYRPGIDITPSAVTYVVSTPGIGGAASGTVVTNDNADTTATSVTAKFGSTASMTFIKPTDRLFVKFACSNSLADNTLIFTTSNVTFDSFQAESAQWWGLRIDGQAAGAKFHGYTHIGHNGRGGLQIRDTDGFARSNGDTTRNISIDLLHVESHYTMLTPVEIRSCKGFDVGRLIIVASTAPPAYVNGGTYASLTGVTGRPNVVDSGGHYWQVKDGVGNFTAASASPDPALWDDMGTRQRMFNVMDESASPGNALNIVQIRGPVTMAADATMRSTEVTLSGDGRSIYPKFMAQGQWIETGVSGDCVLCEWNQGPEPIFDCNFGTTGGATTQLAGTKANKGVRRFGIQNYPFYGNTLMIENMPRTQTRGDSPAQPPTGSVCVYPFTPDNTALISQIQSMLDTNGSGLTTVRFGLGSWDDSSKTYTPLVETATITGAVGNAGNVGTMVGGSSLSTTRGFPSSLLLVRGNRYAFGVIQTGTTGAKFVGTNVRAEAAIRNPQLAAQATAQTDLPTAALVCSTNLGAVVRFEAA